MYASHKALPGLSPEEVGTTCLEFGAIHISNKINGKPNERQERIYNHTYLPSKSNGFHFARFPSRRTGTCVGVGGAHYSVFFSSFWKQLRNRHRNQVRSMYLSIVGKGRLEEVVWTGCQGTGSISLPLESISWDFHDSWVCRPSIT